MGFGVEDVVVEADVVRIGEGQVEVLQRFSRPRIVSLITRDQSLFLLTKSSPCCLLLLSAKSY